MGAAIAGTGVGLIFGVSPVDALIRYVLPIMGGGNGAGAVPLSQVYEQVTGNLRLSIIPLLSSSLPLQT